MTTADETGSVELQDFNKDGEPETIIETHRVIPEPGLTEAEVPDSGWQAWLVVLGAFCANAITIGFVNSTGTIQDYLLTHQLAEESESTVGWIFSVYIFLMMFGGIQTGPLVDTYGVKLLIVPGCLLWCLSLMVLSLCREYYQFILALSILGGVATSLIFSPSFAIISQWFTTKKPVALSIVAIGSSIIGSFLPVVLNILFNKLGYGWGIRIVGFMFMGLSLVCCLTVKSRVRSPKKLKWRDVSIDLKSLRASNFRWAVYCLTISEWAYFLPALYIVGYARTVLGFSNQDSNLLLVYQNISSTVGRFGAGMVARYYGSFNTMIAATLLSGLCALCLWIPIGTTSGGVTAFTVVFGLFSGAGMSVGPACIASISTPTNFGRRYGTTFAIVSLAVLTSHPIGGLLTARDYLGMKIITGAAYLVASFSGFMARQRTPRTSIYL